MGVFAGPDVSESGLVLALDAGNTKSYSNNYHPKPIDIYGWVSGANNATLSRDTISSPVGNTPLKMVVTGSDPYTGSYNNSSYNIASAAQGQTWTFSVWAKASTETTGELFLFEANSSGTYGSYSSPGISITTEWQRFSVTRTLTDAATAYVQVRVDGPNSGGTGVTVWWDGMQVERSSSVSRFTSVYTGEVGIDITGRGNNGTLTNGVSYSDSNSGSFVFDGTNDYVDCGNSSNLSITVGTVCAWFKKPHGSGYKGLVDKGRDGYGAWSLNVDETANTATFKAHISGNNRVIIASSSYGNDIWNYVCGVYDGTNLSIYQNGTLSNSASYSGTIGTNSVSVRVGSANDGLYFNGNIAQVQIYNRALTASEIQQNFNANRSRFGI